MVTMKQQLVSDAVIRTKTYGGGNKRTYITIHETANTSKGANAQAHANLQSNGNARDASWHWQVDDKQAIQSFNHNISCWHGGDGRLGVGNRHSIAIEICVNSDGDFKKAVQNAVALVKHIMLQEKIAIQNVVQHNHWSGKNCPTNLRNGSKGVNWADFIKMVREEVKPVEDKKHVPSKTHADAWKWAKEMKYMNGEFPKNPLTREQFATVLKRVLEDKE